jgi:hypothetical protein
MRIHAGIFLGVAVLAGLASEAQAGRQAYCDAYARDVANARVSGGDVLAGTIGGAVGGAFLGAIIDGKEGAGRGAIIGAAGGTVLGAAGADGKWHRVYRMAYADCLDMYEPRPIVYAKPVPRPAGPLVPGSEAWNDYCAAKYLSFDRKTGLYTAKSGKQRTCVVSP